MEQFDVPVSVLQGKTLTDIKGMVKGGDEIVFTTDTGEQYIMYHSQDCCESVDIVDVCGCVEDLLNSPLLVAEAVSDGAQGLTEEERNKPSDSFTWTFYRFATLKGWVTVRWLGESNGYYSESVDFMRKS